jgi:hypothetical protein
MATHPNEEISFYLDALHTTPDVYESRSAGSAAYDATAVFYVKVSDMRAVFKFQLPGVSPGADPSLNSAIFDSSSNLRYYVFRRLWPTALKINPVHAMMDRAESSGQCGGGGGYTADKSLVKHDFIRYIALQLFNTVNGVDLFQNESDILENITYYGENSRIGIQSVLDTVSTMSADITMNIDSSMNKYSTNQNDSILNISRELMRQIAVSAPARLEDSEFVSAAAAGSLLSVPLVENDTMNIRVTVEAAPGQHSVTNVGAIPARTYNIKLILKESVGGATDTSGNTGVSDSAFFPNAYPYSSNVLDLPAGTATANAVVADASPPVPIPLLRYGYQGWYYTNSDLWVNPAPSVRNKINWYLLPNSATSTVGDLRYVRLNLHVFSRVSTPFLTVYTKATGSGDTGGWYKSKRVYVVANAVGTLSNNTNYCFYVNWNGYSVAPFTVAHSDVALSLTTVGGSSGAVGAFASGEVLFAYSIGTDSGAARGNVEFILSSVIVGEGGSDGSVTEKEYGYIPA